MYAFVIKDVSGLIKFTSSYCYHNVGLCQQMGNRAKKMYANIKYNIFDIRYTDIVDVVGN